MRIWREAEMHVRWLLSLASSAMGASISDLLKSVYRWRCVSVPPIYYTFVVFAQNRNRSDIVVICTSRRKRISLVYSSIANAHLMIAHAFLFHVNTVAVLYLNGGVPCARHFDITWTTNKNRHGNHRTMMCG